MAATADVAVEHIRAQIEAELKGLYNAKFARDFEEAQAKMQRENDIALQAVIAEWKKSQTPPSVDEIRDLLTKDRLVFDVEIEWEDKDGKSTSDKFQIRELPQSVEKAFYRAFKEQLEPRASEFGGLMFNIAAEDDPGKQIKTLLNMLDPGFDLMADAVVMILDPRKRKTDLVTREWVQENLSSYRIWNIIQAQVQVNRLRDFFSELSRGSKGMMPTTLGAARTRS